MVAKLAVVMVAAILVLVYTIHEFRTYLESKQEAKTERERLKKERVEMMVDEAESDEVITEEPTVEKSESEESTTEESTGDEVAAEESTTGESSNHE